MTIGINYYCENPLTLEYVARVKRFAFRLKNVQLSESSAGIGSSRHRQSTPGIPRHANICRCQNYCGGPKRLKVQRRAQKYLIQSTVRLILGLGAVTPGTEDLSLMYCAELLSMWRTCRSSYLAGEKSQECVRAAIATGSYKRFTCKHRYIEYGNRSAWKVVCWGGREQFPYNSRRPGRDGVPFVGTHPTAATVATLYFAWRPINLCQQ